jgi:hypothetical protein
MSIPEVVEGEAGTKKMGGRPVTEGLLEVSVISDGAALEQLVDGFKLVTATVCVELVILMKISQHRLKNPGVTNVCFGCRP